MSGGFPRFVSLFFKSKHLFRLIALVLPTMMLVTAVYILRGERMTGFTFVPASFVVDNWRKPQVFSFRTPENRSYAVVLDFRVDSNLKREAILKRFSDGLFSKNGGDNQIINFEIEIKNSNGIQLIKRSVRTQGINFFSEDDLGRLIDAVDLEAGDYVMTLRLKSDEVLELDDTTVRITYMRK